MTGDGDGRPESFAPAWLDELAVRSLRRAWPVVFGIAGDDGEREEVHRLRGRVVIERGWASPEQLPAGLERDEDDPRAVHITGRADGALVACARIILPGTGGPWPLERFFGLDAGSLGAVAHVDRVAVLRGRGDRGHRVFLGVLGRTWIELRERGVERCAGIVSPAAMRLFASLGLETRVLAGPRLVWGQERLAVLLAPAAVPAAAPRARR